jgi:hypothetical protein
MLCPTDSNTMLSTPSSKDGKACLRKSAITDAMWTSVWKWWCSLFSEASKKKLTK